jgi:predicted DNA-binding protein (UPF0251 family)
MPRPKNCRRIASLPNVTHFKPAGVPIRTLQEIGLSVDEFEALRLADHEGLYQEQAAKHMGVSRQTFGRIVEAARKKVAQVLVEGMALKIEGGKIEMAEMRTFECNGCGHKWEVPFGTGRPTGCPRCESKSFHRAVETATADAAPVGGRRHRRRGQGKGAGRGKRQRKGLGSGRATIAEVSKVTAE